MKTIEKKKSRELRRQGKSFKFIAKTLGVSPSSVMRWTSDIELSESQIVRLYSRGISLHEGRLKWQKFNRDKRIKYQEVGRKRAKTESPEYAMGCMLYWGEGFKDKSVAGISNTDDYLLVKFVNFLRKYFNVNDDKITVKVNIHDPDFAEASKEFWLRRLDLPETSWRKPCFVISKYSKKRKGNIYPLGTCTVRVCSTEIVQQIFGSIKEYAGIQDDRWIK